MRRTQARGRDARPEVTGTQGKRQGGGRPLRVGGTQPLPSAKFVIGVACRVALLSRCLVRYYVGRTVQVCWQTREGGRHAKEADGGEVDVVASEGRADKQSSVSIQVYQMLFITVIPPLWIS